MQIDPHPNAFVADIVDVDVEALDDGEFETLYAAWLRYPILRLRGQSLTDDALKDFSSRFGSLEYAPLGRISAEELAKHPNPYVATISNIIVDGKPIGGWARPRRRGTPTCRTSRSRRPRVCSTASRSRSVAGTPTSAT